MIDPSNAPNAIARWRWIAIGLALVLVTNLANAAMNAASLANQPMICVAAINHPELVDQAIDLQRRPARP